MVWTAAFGFAVVWSVGHAAAAGGACRAAITRANVASCALAASLELREGLAAQRAASGRRETARTFLPTNPTLSASIGTRRSDTDRDSNWSLSLGQQIEVAGQRGLRVEVADHELAASRQRFHATRIRVAAEAWTEYFAVLATSERLELARRLETATSEVATTVRAMAASGVASDIDSDIADAAALRVTQGRLALESALASDKARLAVLTGAPEATISGELEPLKGVTVPAHVPMRPEVLALGEERAAYERRAALLKRERVPNPTLALLAQDDGFNERVLGIGLTLPIPVPEPLGRTNAGAIAEAAALADQAEASRDGTQRLMEAEVASAVADFDAAARARALYSSERVTRALTRLDSIATQVKAGRLAVRDGLIAQQALVEQLEAQIDARAWLCTASVRLSRATGASLEGDAL